VELGTVTRGVEAVGANGEKGLARDILENFSKSCQARKVKLGKDPSRRGLTISESRVVSMFILRRLFGAQIIVGLLTLAQKGSCSCDGGDVSTRLHSL
jgi:hypothetical protein